MPPPRTLRLFWEGKLQRGRAEIQLFQAFRFSERTLDIEEGEFFSLLGPNGAGKTTTIKMLCTLLLPDSGTATINGYDIIRDSQEVRANIGVCIRGERSVYWKLTARENMEYFAILYHIYGKEAKNKIEQLLHIVGLADRADDYVERYSMGMKQKLSIACSLLNDPAVLLLDEPTAGLDPIAAQQLRKFIKETICRERGITVVYTTHNMVEADELSDRVGILVNGKLIALGTPAELKRQVGEMEVIEVEVESVPPDIVIDKLRECNSVRAVTVEKADRFNNLLVLRIQTPDQRKFMPVVIDLLNTHSEGIKQLRVIEPTLEDVFIGLTGETVRDSGELQSV